MEIQILEKKIFMTFQYLYYHINHDIIKISFGTNMHCSLAEICAMTTFNMLFILFSHAKFSVNFALFSWTKLIITN